MMKRLSLLSSHLPSRLPSLLCLLMLFAFGCTQAVHDNGHEDGHEDNELAEGEVPLTTEQAQALNLQLGGFEHITLAEPIQANGVIDLPPNNKVAVHAVAQGFVQELNYIPGQAVQEGDVIAVLRDPIYARYQADYLLAWQDFRYAKGVRDRAESLFQQSITSAQEWEAVQTTYQNARTRWIRQKQQITAFGWGVQKIQQGHVFSTIAIRAPISGVISAVRIHKGRWVETNSPLVEIIDNEHIHLELQVFQQYIPLVKEGMLVEFWLPVLQEDSIYAGEIIYVGKNINPLTRTFLVHVHFETTPHTLPGLYVEARLLHNRSLRRVLPAAAVFTHDNADYFFVTTNRLDAVTSAIKFKKIPFEAGLRTPDYVEVLRYTASEIDTTAIVVENAFGLYAKDRHATQPHGHHH